MTRLWPRRPRAGKRTATDDPGEAASGLATWRVAVTGAYLAPPALAVVLACLVTEAGVGPFEARGAALALAGGILFVGLAAGAWTGSAAAAAHRRILVRQHEERLGDFDHDLRGPLTIVRGEVELVLSQEDVPIAERARSAAAIVEQLEQIERRLRQRYQP